MNFCKVCGKPEVKAKGLCTKHYSQLLKYGKTMDTNPRTVYDKNEIRIVNDYAEIDTYDQFGNVQITYKIDIEDIPLLDSKKWRTVFKGKLKDTPYLCTEHTIYFHRLVMGNTNIEVDHINRDSTDNRKNNLRESFRTQQLGNTRMRIDNVEGLKGVYYSNRDKVYRAEIQAFNKHYYSKSFNTKAEAAYMRYLFEQYFYKDIGINNSNLMFDLIQQLSNEQKHNIQNYFINRMKIRVQKDLRKETNFSKERQEEAKRRAYHKLNA